MSSLSATQADGYYIPPDYINSGAYKKKSLNQFNKSQTKGKGKGTGKINSSNGNPNNVGRFELPYDGFCRNSSCGAHVGKGTRFNALKTQVGNYHTTKVWEFTMKCRICAKEQFVLRTNPKERAYDYVHGIKRKMEEFDTVEAQSLGVIDTDKTGGHAIHNFKDGQIQDICEESGNGNDNDVISKLERAIAGQRKTMSERDAMELLLKKNQASFFDDASSNSTLRAQYRVHRKTKKRRIHHAASLGLGRGILVADKDDCDDAHKDLDLARSRSTFEDRKKKSAHSNAKSREVERFQSIRKGIRFFGNEQFALIGSVSNNPIKGNVKVNIKSNINAATSTRTRTSACIALEGNTLKKNVIPVKRKVAIDFAVKRAQATMVSKSTISRPPSLSSYKLPQPSTSTNLNQATSMSLTALGNYGSDTDED